MFLSVWMLAAGTSEYTEVKAFGSIIYGSQVKFTVVQYLLILCTPGEHRNVVVWHLIMGAFRRLKPLALA